jgi:predicted secreted protein
MKRVVFALIGISILLTTNLWAEMNSNLKIIGFSEDGAYLAFEVSGYDTSTGDAFSLIQIVDVEKNDFVADDFLVQLTDVENGKRQLEEGALSETALRKAEAAVRQYGILTGNEGTLVYERIRDSAEHEASFSISSGGARQQYGIILSLRSVESNHCAHLTAEGRTPKIFTLTLHRGERRKILQNDSVLYRSRNCPYDYGIYRVYALGNHLAVFLDSYTSGANVHKLVVTGTLEFPEIAMRASPETADQIEKYKYKGNEKSLDSGRILAQLVADESTYDHRHGSDSYRKLLITDKRRGQTSVRALILPPQGPYYDYPYYIHDVYDGENKLILLTAKDSFYIYDILQNALSPLVKPGKDKPWIGVDGRSGNLVRCRFSSDGTRLSGAIVHQGNFVYDITDPLNPREIDYRADFNTND